MLNLDFFDEFKIKKCNNCIPSSITLIDQHFYICYPAACCILCFNDTFSCCNYIYVNGNYAAICYDPSQDCFYAIDKSYSDQIFVLNHNFQEVDHITILQTGYHSLTSIICDENTIYIAASSEIISIDIAHPDKQNVFQHEEDITALKIDSSYLFIASQNNQHNTLFIYDVCDHLIENIELPAEVCIYGMTLLNSSIFLLTETCNGQFKVLKGCICQEEIEENDTTCCCACNQSCLFQKIADIEGSIACILDTEGRKIQYAIQANATIKELLEINSSVQMTIQQIIQLEFTLLSKLSLCLCGSVINDCETDTLFEQCSEL